MARFTVEMQKQRAERVRSLGVVPRLASFAVVQVEARVASPNYGGLAEVVPEVAERWGLEPRTLHELVRIYRDSRLPAG